MNMIEEYGSPIEKYLERIPSKTRRFLMKIYLIFLMSKIYDFYCNMKGIPAAGYCYYTPKRHPQYDGKPYSYRINQYMKTSKTGKQYWCLRHRADTVVGSGISGDCSPIKDIEVYRLVNWEPENIRYHRESATIEGLRTYTKEDVLYKRFYGHLFWH